MSFDYELKSLYAPLNEYISTHNTLSFLEFNYQTSNNISLFLSSSTKINIDEVSETVEMINKTMGSINRIFLKPIIHLKEHSTVVPIETCRTIDHRTIVHLAMHSEIWQNIKDGEVLPRKLLTRTYSDNYSIYENIVFAYTVNQVLNFIKHNVHLMKDLLDNSQSIQINYLDKQEHVQYFLALANLHTSYIKNYDRDAQRLIALLENLLNVNDVLLSKRHRPVYKNNYKKARHIILKSTNILNMQRDYHRVYKLAKYFQTNKINHVDIIQEDKEFEQYFYDYCLSLLIFSTSNFSFIADKDALIDFNNVNINFDFKTYKLNIKNFNNIGFALTFNKDKEYKILLLSYQDKIEKETSEIFEKYKNDFNSIYFLIPYYNNDDRFIYLSINNLNSFRRIQQILLKGMVYSNIEFDICPFCGEKLTKNKSTYICKHCLTKIEKKHCPTTNQDYFETSIYKFSTKNADEETKIDLETHQHYRNITKIATSDSFICPCCHKVHKD